MGIDRLLDFIKEGKEDNAQELEEKKLTLTQLCETFVPIMFENDDVKDNRLSWMHLLVQCSRSSSWQNVFAELPEIQNVCESKSCNEPVFQDRMCMEHYNYPTKEHRIQDALKKNNIRTRVLAEIVETEVTYVKSLGLLSSLWAKVIRKKVKDLKISEQDMRALISNIESLQIFHAEQFLRELQDAQKKDPTTIPEVFNQYYSCFKLYIEYLKGYEPAINTINRLQMKNKKFASWLEQQQEKIKKESKKELNQEEALMSHFIKPVQRVPRYVLLLRELK